jgi:uncharacterized protein YndB with AHSA1/START domain
VYRSLLDAEAVQDWMEPDGMTSHVHSFDAREGGTFRISLTYDLPTTAGKTSSQTDSFHGRFVKLVPDTEVVQVVEFETDDPTMQGEMTITYRLADADGGTDLTGLHENLPPGVLPADNELGWSMSIEKLARLVEGRPGRDMPAVEDLADAAIQLARDDDRDRAVRRLRDLAGDRRGLEAVRDHFVDRLHRRADDFDATRGLQLVITVLQRVPTSNGHRR